MVFSILCEPKKRNLGQLDSQDSSLPFQIDVDPTYLVKEWDGPICRLLIGKVYSRFKNLSELSTTLRISQNAVFNIHGRFLFLEFDTRAKILEIHQDKYRLLAPMVYLERGRFWIGNRIEDIPNDITFSPCQFGIDFLKIYGVVPPPYTLFQELKLIGGSASLNLEDFSLSMGDYVPLWPGIEHPHFEVSDVAEIFRGVVENICSVWRPTTFRLSGGVDTRTVASVIPNTYRAMIQGEVYNHPDLAREEDRDIIGAFATGRAFGVDVRVVETAHRVFFLQDQWKPILGGLYGGEFLGGLYSQIAPWDRATYQKDTEVCNLWEARKLQVGYKRFQFELFLNSFRSTIYQSVNRSWASPRLLNVYCLSPFVEGALLDMVLGLSTECLRGYCLYAKLFRFLVREHCDLPMSSPIVLLQEGFTAFDRGEDPKTKRSLTEEVQNDLNLSDLNLFNFFRNHRSLLRSHDDKSLLENSR